MRIIAIFLAAILFLGIGIAMAAEDETNTLNIPVSGVVDGFKKLGLDNGFCYSAVDGKFNYSATIKVIGTKDGKFALNAGYAGRAKDTCDKLIVTGSASLLKLKDYLDVPILDLIVFDPYVYAGYHVNTEAIGKSQFDWGPGAKILKMTFN